MHEKKHADCTIAVYSVPWNEASRFGIMNTNEEGDIVEFEEKPANPKSNNASMGIYVFNWKDLKQYLIEDEENPESSNDFGKNIIPRMLAEGKHMVAYPFEGYWKDVGTIESLWEANMDLLQSPPAFNLYDSAWRIYARNPTLPPHYIAKTAEVSDSMVTEGCTVAGKVDHSILFSGAIVENSVIMNGARICKGARIRRAIVSENAVVGPDSVVGGNGRIAVVGQETVLPEYSVVKPGEQIDMEVLAKREAKAEEDAK